MKAHRIHQYSFLAAHTHGTVPHLHKTFTIQFDLKGDILNHENERLKGKVVPDVVLTVLDNLVLKTSVTYGIVTIESAAENFARVAIKELSVVAPAIELVYVKLTDGDDDSAIVFTEDLLSKSKPVKSQPVAPHMVGHYAPTEKSAPADGVTKTAVEATRTGKDSWEGYVPENFDELAITDEISSIFADLSPKGKIEALNNMREFANRAESSGNILEGADACQCDDNDTSDQPKARIAGDAIRIYGRLEIDGATDLHHIDVFDGNRHYAVNW